MEDKKTALFAKAYLILCEAYCEEHGCKLINPRVVVNPDISEEEGSTACE